MLFLKCSHVIYRNFKIYTRTLYMYTVSQKVTHFAILCSAEFGVIIDDDVTFSTVS